MYLVTKYKTPLKEHSSWNRKRKCAESVEKVSLSKAVSLGSLFLLKSRPLNADGHGETDGAADGDVVERVEKLGEEKSVETAVKGERP